MSMILVVNDELGGNPALVSEEALEQLLAPKGFRRLTDEEVAQHEVDTLNAQTPGIENAVTPEQAALAAGQPLSAEELEAAYDKAGLVELADDLGVDSSGTKAQIAARIVEARESDAAADADNAGDAP